MPLKLNTVGADPELFLKNQFNIVSAVGLLGGTKEAPLPVLKGAIQEDNVLAEFNIDPVTTENMFVNHIDTVMRQLAERVKPHGLSLLVQSSHDFDIMELMESGEQALRFGCEPDMNAWTTETNPPPDSTTTLRTAGGHIHLGIDVPERDIDTRLRTVKLMDIFVGIPSVLLDTDNQRRALYGKAGACRIKPYGVEYRTLSNFWLKSEESQRWAYRQTHRAVQEYDNLDDILRNISPEVIQNTINHSDIDMAQRICADLRI